MGDFVKLPGKLQGNRSWTWHPSSEHWAVKVDGGDTVQCPQIWRKQKQWTWILAWRLVFFWYTVTTYCSSGSSFDSKKTRQVYIFHRLDKGQRISKNTYFFFANTKIDLSKWWGNLCPFFRWFSGRTTLTRCCQCQVALWCGQGHGYRWWRNWPPWGANVWWWLMFHIWFRNKSMFWVNRRLWTDSEPY